MKRYTDSSIAGRFVTLTLAALVSYGCAQEAVEPAAPVARPVKMLVVGSAAGGATMEFPGSISATQNAEMAFEVAGQVIDIPVEEGEDVARGQVLARLDDRDYQAARDRVLAQRNAARADYFRYEEAFKADAVTAQDVDLAKRNLDVAEADLRTATKALEDTILRAPFDGRVAVKRIDVFEAVQAKQSVMLIQDESGLEIEINVAERDFAQSEAGLSLEELTERIQPQVEMASIPGRRFPAQIISNTSAADPVTRTYSVTLAFEKPDDLNIRPGMTGRVVISARPEIGLEEAGVFIPADAVLADDSNNPFVWLVDEATSAVNRRAIEVGEMSADRIRVRGGLAVGDRIAISGVSSLRDGMLVREFR